MCAVSGARKMRILKFTALVALVLPSAAQAEWLSIGSSVADAEYYMDGDRIKSVSGRRQAWVKVDHSRDRSVTYRESMRLLSFDCGKQTYKLLYASNTDSYGKQVSSFNYSDSAYGVGYVPIVPESMAETIGKVACYEPSGS